MVKKEVRVRYTELMTLLNIFRVTVDMDCISIEIREIKVLFLEF